MASPETGAAWLVLPTYEEAANIEPLVSAVRDNLPASAQILIVDDNSPDGTGRLADELAAANERIFVQHRKVKSGLGDAYRVVAVLLHRDRVSRTQVGLDQT